LVEYATVEALRERHSAWRLLLAGNSTLILSFLGEFFVEGNRGACPASDVAAALDDHLYALNTEIPAENGQERFPKDARSYLEDWAAIDAAYLRRFYPLEDGLGERVRLEQERIDWRWVEQRLLGVNRMGGSDLSARR
jgi:Protein of unknown function (DUF3375)